MPQIGQTQNIVWVLEFQSRLYNLNKWTDFKLEKKFEKKSHKNIFLILGPSKLSNQKKYLCIIVAVSEDTSTLN